MCNSSRKASSFLLRNLASKCQSLFSFENQINEERKFNKGKTKVAFLFVMK